MGLACFRSVTGYLTINFRACLQGKAWFATKPERRFDFGKRCVVMLEIAPKYIQTQLATAPIDEVSDAE
jgi:hypothetical protein